MRHIKSVCIYNVTTMSNYLIRVLFKELNHIYFCKPMRLGNLLAFATFSRLFVFAIANIACCSFVHNLVILKLKFSIILYFYCYCFCNMLVLLFIAVSTEF